MENENPRRKQNNDEPVRRRSIFFAEWMGRLAALYQREISLETQTAYFQALSKVPLDRLEYAFVKAGERCRFFPSVAELLNCAEEFFVSQEKLDIAYERLKVRLAAQGEVKTLHSVLDALPAFTGDIGVMKAFDLKDCTAEEKRQWSIRKAKERGWR